MRFKLTIDCGNAAFEDDPTLETARILRALADRLEGASPDEDFRLRDGLGNRVGEAGFSGRH